MINALHLCWIIPTAIILGMLVTAIIVGVTQSNKEYEAYMAGIEKGKSIAYGKDLEEGINE